MSARRRRRVPLAFRQGPSDVVTGEPALELADGPGAPALPDPFSDSLPPPPEAPPESDEAGRRISEVRRRVRPSHAVATGETTTVRSPLDAVGSAAPDVTPQDPCERLLYELVTSGPESTEAWEAPLFRQADAMLPLLAEIFPGPLWFDRNRPHRGLPGGDVVGAVPRALVLLGERSRPWVATLQADPREHDRFHACLVAARLAHPELLDPLAHSLLEGEADVRMAAQHAVRSYGRAPEATQLLAALRVLAVSEGRRTVWRLRAIEALGALGDPAAPDALVELLAHGNRAMARAAHHALRRITAHDLGTLRQPWRRWLRNQRGRPRASWLVAALVDRRPELREHALSELERVARRGVDVAPEAPQRAWAEAQARYAVWLAKRFG